MEKKEADQERQNEKKWGKNLMRAGWTAIPSTILERQQALGLDAMDVAILLHLAKFWWQADNLPRPAKSTIAEALGVEPRTIQRRIAQMEKDGLIKRIGRKNADGGNGANFYSLDGLKQAAEKFAIEAIATREKQAEERRAAGRRKKLQVIPGGRQ